MELTILFYETPQGKSPFLYWLNDLKNIQGRAIIRARIERIRLGNFGDVKSLGDGVFEFRVNTGPGYRIYFGQSKNQTIILLCGGNKKSQKKDIILAKFLWRKYKNAG
jgi:putative addiction module killer protein